MSVARPVFAVLLLVSLTLALGASSAQAATEAEGYLELSDGTRLRYTALLPSGTGPFPVVLQYSGYSHGNNAYDGTFGDMVDQVLAEGIAVVGVNLRGSGCSQGTFAPFTSQWATDGVEVVDWIADQDWSDGNVAMAGVSYPAITSLVTAVERPEALKAVMASVPVIDLYPDVAWPGGIFNSTFASVWTVLQKYGTLFGVQETAEGDVDCPLAWPTQNDPTDVTGVQAATSPYKDSMSRYTEFLQPEDLARIEVPALVYTAWQDEQLGSRAMYGYEHLDEDRRWIVASNGDHIGFAGSAWYRQLGTEFLRHFLTGGAVEDFDHPQVMIARDVRADDATFGELDAYDTYPVPTQTTTLHAHPDGSLRLTAPTTTATLDYAYPLPAPSVPVGIDIGVGVNPSVYNESYKAPVPPGGSVAFTTPPLAEHLQLHGPGSVDLWLSSTSDDADLQVTLTEVRPDGNELYVQRGWLRASHRRLDAQRSTSTRPVQTHLEADTRPLRDDGPTPLRVELWPVDHVVRAGSSLRLHVEAPVGMTGFRQLAASPTPATNVVHVGPDTPTRFVFGRIADPQVATARPACDTLLNMPCRTNPTPPPEGELTLAAAPDDGNGASSTPAGSPDPPQPSGGTLPATGGGLGAAAASVLLGTAVLGRRHR